MPDSHYIIIRAAKINGRPALQVIKRLEHTSHSSKDADGSGTTDVFVDSVVIGLQGGWSELWAIIKRWIFKQDF